MSGKPKVYTPLVLWPPVYDRASFEAAIQANGVNSRTAALYGAYVQAIYHAQPARSRVEWLEDQTRQVRRVAVSAFRAYERFIGAGAGHAPKPAHVTEWAEKAEKDGLPAYMIRFAAAAFREAATGGASLPDAWDVRSDSWRAAVQTCWPSYRRYLAEKMLSIPAPPPSQARAVHGEIPDAVAIGIFNLWQLTHAKYVLLRRLTWLHWVHAPDGNGGIAHPDEDGALLACPGVNRIDASLAALRAWAKPPTDYAPMVPAEPGSDVAATRRTVVHWADLGRLALLRGRQEADAARRARTPAPTPTPPADAPQSGSGEQESTVPTSGMIRIRANGVAKVFGKAVVIDQHNVKLERPGRYTVTWTLAGDPLAWSYTQVPPVDPATGWPDAGAAPWPEDELQATITPIGGEK